MKIHAKIQRWGNGLALRISGVLRDIPHFKEGSEVIIDVTEAGFIVKKILPKKQRVGFTEAQLLKEMTPLTAHADEVAEPRDHEIGE